MLPGKNRKRPDSEIKSVAMKEPPHADGAKRAVRRRREAVENSEFVIRKRRLRQLFHAPNAQVAQGITRFPADADPNGGRTRRGAQGRIEVRHRSDGVPGKFE